MSAAEPFGPLVSVQWLAQHLTDPDLLLFDASAYLPTEGKDGAVEFRKAHLPGAHFFDIDLFSDADTDLPHMAPSPGRFARLAGEIGIHRGKQVVFYDQNGLFSAARAWWLLRLFGHGRVAVLDGGLPYWQAQGLPTTTGDTPPATPASFRAELRNEMLRGLGDLRANLDSRTSLVLDARAAARFAGDAPEPRPGVTPGHIPHSASLPFDELLQADKRFKPVAALRERFAQAGVDGSRPVITSCGSGVTAAVLLLGMLVAGLPEGALYDGSWTEWGSHPDTPKGTT